MTGTSPRASVSVLVPSSCELGELNPTPLLRPELSGRPDRSHKANAGASSGLRPGHRSESRARQLRERGPFEVNAALGRMASGDARSVQRA